MTSSVFKQEALQRTKTFLCAGDELIVAVTGYATVAIEGIKLPNHSLQPPSAGGGETSGQVRPIQLTDWRDT